MNKLSKQLLSLAVTAAIAFGAYLGWTEIQSWRGQRALVATQLHFATLPEALAQSHELGRPVLADFSAIWCPSCRAMHEAFADPRVREVLQHAYVLARIDADSPEAAEFQRRFGVEGFPTLLVLDADGQLLRRVPASGDPVQLAHAL